MDAQIRTTYRPFREGVARMSHESHLRSMTAAHYGLRQLRQPTARVFETVTRSATVLAGVTLSRCHSRPK